MFFTCIFNSNTITFACINYSMDSVLSNISVKVNENVFLKNPESSKLGKKILSGSIDLIDEIGLDEFTFKKLANAIGSTEASIYRYFESKHKLLLYLTSWYWSWMEYKLVFRIVNIDSPEERLTRAIKLVTEQVEEDGNIPHINEIKLHHILISESSKAYLTKSVDNENKHGVFSGYKQFVQRLSDIVLEINSNYKYPHMLISTVIEGSHHQRYFAEHLPKLTDIVSGEDSISCFYNQLVFKAINEE